MIIIIKSHNNYCSVGVMELCLLNLLILSDCFVCNSYPSGFELLFHKWSAKIYGEVPTVRGYGGVL